MIEEPYQLFHKTIDFGQIVGMQPDVECTLLAHGMLQPSVGRVHDQRPAHVAEFTWPVEKHRATVTDNVVLSTGFFDQRWWA